jgi:hypothetical protein
MQTFGTNGAACKAAMQQGQVVVLNDTRNNQKYRVKKMPDGNVWMIDNLKLGSTTSTTTLTSTNTNIISDYILPIINNTTGNGNPTSAAYCLSNGAAYTENPGSFTGCGYLYNWDTAIANTASNSGYSISTKGWGLHPNTGTKSTYELNEKMLAAAADTAGNRNPVYSTTFFKNFGMADTGNTPPWLGVRSGGCISTGSLNNQGNYGVYLSGVEYDTTQAYNFYFDFTVSHAQNHSNKSTGFAIRSVL